MVDIWVVAVGVPYPLAKTDPGPELYCTVISVQYNKVISVPTLVRARPGRGDQMADPFHCTVTTGTVT